MYIRAWSAAAAPARIGRGNMRWFVEISPLGPRAAPTTTVCVEAAGWQPALQAARALQGDNGALSDFSIELMENGYRAIDPAARRRYALKRAPDDAPITGTQPVELPLAAAEVMPRKRPAAPTVAFVSQGAAAVVAPPGMTAPAAAVPSGPRKREPTRTVAFTSPGAAHAYEGDEPTAGAGAAEPEPLAGLPPFTLVGAREEDPSPRSPLRYREFVFAVAAGTTEEEGHRLILDRFEFVRRTLAQERPGKLVNLAVFDHQFEEKPRRKPLVTLTWKDWKNEPPEVRFPQREEVAAKTAPEIATVGAPAATMKAAQPGSLAGALSASMLVAPAKAEPIARGGSPLNVPEPAVPWAVTAATTLVSPVLAPIAAVEASQNPPARRRGDDLLSDLFKAFGDLHFLRDALEGADFVLALALEKLPSEVGLVSLFDSSTKRFVVVRQLGGSSALTVGVSESATIPSAAIRKHHAIVASSLPEPDERWAAIGFTPRSLLCAPVEGNGRPLGLLELANPLDGSAFSEGDTNALTYIGQQFAEFVSAHGVIVDPEKIRAAPPPSRSGAARGR